MAVMIFATSCGGDDPEPVPPTPDPTPVTPDEPDEPEIPDDPTALYNGIKLPAQWPPQRNYASEIRRGMTPFYLTSKPEAIRIDVGRQLFVDNFLIASTTLERKFHYPEYYAGNPILMPDQSWEKQGANGGFAAPFSDGVWYDETDGKFKMWYMAGGGTYATGGAGITCYAESADGINWTKPSLNVIQGTNIVRRGSVRDASTVWIDKQETNASQRFKMFEVSGGAGKWAYHYLTSSDGKAWRDNSTPSGRVADRSTVYKNPFRNVWVWSMRHNVRVNSSDPYTVRARDYMENEDAVAGNKAAVADLKYFWFGPWANEQKHPFYNNNDGAPGIYNQDAMPYESIMLGMFSVWQGPENDVCSKDGVIKRNQIMLGYSRDGYSWFREDMNPFLAVDENLAAWNNGNLQSAVGSPLIVNDKLYFYLSGRKLVDGAEVVTTGLATLRRDGFASMSGTGSLTTELLKFKGSHFFVNADVHGSLKVELLDSKGNVITGFSKEDCLAVTGDGTKTRVNWKNANLASITNKLFKVRFYLEDGDLYSFWVSDSESGESRGYTGGGGPGYHPSGLDIK
ncbi:MAG: hypothetical protein NC453_11745 [Muribaculum sp.]|nr:hypothetical protein [Muribaculum sp.]